MPNLNATTELTVTRNGKSLVFTPTPFKKGEKKKQELNYPGLEITKENLNDFIEFMGDEDFFPLLNAKTSQLFQSVYDASTKNGTSDWLAKDNAEMLEKLSTRGETKAVLEEKLKDLRNELIELTPIMMDVSNTEHGKAMLRFAAIVAETKKLSDALESKKRVKSDDDEEEKTGAVAQS